jgi:hypothetical protein
MPGPRRENTKFDCNDISKTIHAHPKLLEVTKEATAAANGQAKHYLGRA